MRGRPAALPCLNLKSLKGLCIEAGAVSRYSVGVNKQAIQERLDGLRAAMREAGLAAWVVFSTDPHMSEYVPQRWQARAWLSGFDGSAGTLVVTAEAGAASGGTVGGRAALWTDGRYYLQADEQLADTGIELIV